MKKYNVFVDFHHASLLHSFILLFEKRLAGNVYRPIGREWYDKGYWKIYDHPATVAQYLDIGGATPDGTQKLNEVLDDSSGIYKCQDIDSGLFNKAITYDAFMRLPIDIVIASVPQHVEPFKRLAASHPNKPKVIFQIGNAWTVEAGQAPNVMASAIVENVPPDVNFISYHQEFDLDTFYPDLIAHDRKKVSSFVNCFDISEHFANDYWLFKQVEEHMPDWEFKIYGGQCRDGAAHGAKELAEKMRDARFVWHTKWGGDGYGHIIHNASAVGRPLIVKKLYYQGKMAEPLLLDGQTCIVVDGLNYEQIINKIEYYSDPARYYNMCMAAYQNFLSVVDFNLEAKNISNFLENLK